MINNEPEHLQLQLHIVYWRSQFIYGVFSLDGQSASSCHVMSCNTSKRFGKSDGQLLMHATLKT